MNTILIVEDEVLIANYIREVLCAEGYQVVGIARDFHEAVNLFKEFSPTVVCMDIHLKNHNDGIELAEYLRQLGPFTLIYLTAYGDRENIQRAQCTKPFGFLVKPVTDQTIVATITTAMTNDPHINMELPQQVFRIDCGEDRFCVVNCDTGFLKMGEQQVHLTPKESRLLGILLGRHGEIVPFRKLITEIWKDCAISDTSLKTLVWRLRRKLPERDLIQTLPGFGYRIELPTEKITSYK